MKTPQPHRAFALAACAVFALATLARAGSVSSSQTAPVINDADLANYGAVSGTDKWWVSTSEPDSHARGQSFMTGPGALRLKAITYQTSTATVPTKNFTIRVGKLNGTTFTESYSETATQDANWNAGDYVTWTFDSPPILDGNTVYGVDVGFNSSSTAWQTGIPYINLSDNEFPGGSRYTSGNIHINSKAFVELARILMEDVLKNPRLESFDLYRSK